MRLNACASRSQRLGGVERRCATGVRPSSIRVSDHSITTRLKIEVYDNDQRVGEALVKLVQSAAVEAIAEKGFFTLAVPGGSVLKMLEGLKTSPISSGIDWKRVYLSYVNHKAVPIDDKSSTHQKARNLFIDALELQNFIAVTGTSDAKVEAEAYEAALRAQAKKLGTISSSGLPALDLCLIGMGSDGHVGSLYPNAPATTTKSTAESNWILPVVKADGSSSISFSHSLMSSAKSIVICCTGAKKAPAVVTALEMNPPEGQMPARMIKPLLPSSEVTWLIDSGAASALTAVKGIKLIQQ